MNLYHLNERQKKKLSKLINDDRGLCLELPSDMDDGSGLPEKVKIIKADGEAISEISMAKAAKL